MRTTGRNSPLRDAIRATCPEREAELDLALFTGMRRGEQFTLKWADVHRDQGYLEVHGKTGRRQVQTNAKTFEAIEQLRKRRTDSDFVCTETQRDGQADWRRWFEKAVKAARIRNFHWHDLRHTFCSRELISGLDIRTVQKLAGHASIVTTTKYAHLSPEHLREAAKKIGG